MFPSKKLSTQELIDLHHKLLVSSGLPRSRFPKFALLSEKLREDKAPSEKFFVEAVEELKWLSEQTKRKLKKAQEELHRMKSSTQEELERAERLYKQDLSSFQALIPLIKELFEQAYPQLLDA
ncbi:hypothetical protein MK805_13190 [Shimazuella sp. AN120528]|uniref:hypothetical protein n=1 Tax=Shimazuella soli TaxID=1892854 RepID=UPI001F0F4835|nr:hypothetical protein [Shimazuella soli]MCH5585895.1 hypothetical protein [Shimazuella soli]